MIGTRIQRSYIQNSIESVKKLMDNAVNVGYLQDEPLCSMLATSVAQRDHMLSAISGQLVTGASCGSHTRATKSQLKGVQTSIRPVSATLCPGFQQIHQVPDRLCVHDAG